MRVIILGYTTGASTEWDHSVHVLGVYFSLGAARLGGSPCLCGGTPTTPTHEQGPWWLRKVTFFVIGFS